VNINVLHHLDEDTKFLKVFPIPLQNEKGLVFHYDRMALSPDIKVIVVTHGFMLQWLSLENGEILDTAIKLMMGISHVWLGHLTLV